MKIVLNLIAILTITSTTLEASQLGHCPVGPFGTDGDLGEYDGQCQHYTRHEICEAYFEAIRDGEVSQVDPAKVQFCKVIAPKN